MFTGNTETGISATYQDGDGTIDLVVSGGGGGTIGIGDGEYLGAGPNVADNDFLRVDGTLIEGRTAAETLSDIAAMPLAGGRICINVSLSLDFRIESQEPQFNGVCSHRVMHSHRRWNT